MNAKKFSVAMGEIDTKYVSEAINYKPKSKILSFHKWAVPACIAACILLIATAFITRNKDVKLQVYIGEDLITNEPISLPDVGRSMTFSVGSQPINIQLLFSSSEDTDITVSEGNIEMKSSDSSDIVSFTGTAHINGDCTIWWKIDNADKEKTYDMQLKNKTQEFTVFLKFDEINNTWIVYGE
ncbi:MAG: hypothetical protein ACI4II_05100 [Acutalibacteraceae bacterium]